MEYHAPETHLKEKEASDVHDYEDDDKIRFGRVPLLADELALDDAGATIVFIFPCSDECGGTVQADTLQKDPLGSAKRIFYRDESYYRPPFTLFEELKEQNLTVGRYHEIIRAELLGLLQREGFWAQSSESIDKDEVFLKVGLGTQSDQLGALAEHHRYRMPISTSLYTQKVNGMKQRVPAYTEFSNAARDKFESFGQCDEIRVIYTWLYNRINLNEMADQGLIVAHFPSAKYKEMLNLYQEWGRFGLVCRWPTPQDLQLIRNYFGEQIAFYFAWFQTYMKALGILAIGATLVKMREYSFWPMSLSKFLTNIYAVFLVGWVAAVQKQFRRKASRLEQLWGMVGWDNQQAVTRPSYKPELEGTKRAFMLKFAGNFVMVTFILLFAGAIISVQYLDKQMRDNGDGRLRNYTPYIVAVSIKVFDFAWGKIAKTLVEWQNHRTEARFDDALAGTLAAVKLFVVLFPFLQIAFLQGNVDVTCAKTTEEAAVSVYALRGWPTGTRLYDRGVDHTNVTLLRENMEDGDLDFLANFISQSMSGNMCIAGCFPSVCRSKRVAVFGESRFERTLVCWTNCWVDLRKQLLTYYALQFCSAFAFLIIPVVIVKIAIILEIARVKGINPLVAIVRGMVGLRVSSRADSDSSIGSEYSFLQYQAKCNVIAPYMYKSWGGSYVEDFMDLLANYSLLACFSTVAPGMVVVNFVALFLTYRIVAFRMNNVTGRPFPSGAEGIGVWQAILDSVAVIAVTINVALLTFYQSPVKTWPQGQQLFFFIFAEKVLFSIRALVEAAFPNEPDDVTHIEDVYEKVSALEFASEPAAPANGYDYSLVQVGLYPHMDESCSDTNSDGADSHSALRQRGFSKRNVYYSGV